MSFKTLRLSNDSAIVAAARSALRRTALACAVSVVMLAPAASYALELGPATVISGLGQSLLVEIPYRLSAGEQLTPACISLAPAQRPAGALPAYTRASRISVTPTHIEILGDSRVVEPLIGLHVDVHCQATPRFVRSYELFVDPPVRMPTVLSNGPQLAAVPASQSATPAVESRPVAASQPRATVAPAASNSSASAVPAAPRASTSPRARGQTGGTLTQGETYLVVRGDTLSGIASRVGDRPTLRETAEAIFAANAEAFTRGNRDLLEAGRSITIPVFTAAAAALAAPVATAVPEVPSADPPAALPSANVAPASEALPLPAQVAPSAVAPAAVEPPAPVAAVQPSAAPTQAPIAATPPAVSPPATSARSSTWLTALLALGAAILLSAPVLFIRRRKQEPAAPNPAKARSAPRQLVDPIAGFDVVEGEPARTPTVKIEKIAAHKHTEAPAVAAHETAAADATAAARNISPTDPVDLDVGSPMVDESVDWFGARADAATVATPAVTAAPTIETAATMQAPTIETPTIESAATARMPGLERTATVRQPPLKPAANVTDPTLDDQGHTLTIVEIDMLRQDYEAEHTLTQHGNKELREALADLKATQAARAGNGDTATIEMPAQPSTEELESQPTQKLRSAR